VIDSAESEFLTTLGSDDASAIRQAAEEYLEAVSEHGKAIDREEAVELITQHTDYNKSTVKEWADEIGDAVTRKYITVHGVAKVERWDPDEDMVYEIDVEARGQRATLRIESGGLMSSHEFEKQLLELTDVPVEIDEWRETLRDWLDAAPIEERMELPIDIEHSVAEQVIDRISGLEPTYDYEEFRFGHGQNLHVDDDEREALVPAKVVDTSTASDQNISRRKLRSILNDLLVGHTQSVRRDDDFFRAWRFDLDRLVAGDIIDLSALEDEDEDDAEDAEDEDDAEDAEDQDDAEDDEDEETDGEPTDEQDDPDDSEH
jgi:hypothetical protein